MTITQMTQASRRDLPLPEYFEEKQEFNERYIKQPEPEKTYTIYPLLHKQLQELHIPEVISSLDGELNRFLKNVKDFNNFSRKITAMCRIKILDRLNPETHQKKEFLIYYETFSGTDNAGNPLAVHDIPKGIDQNITYTQRTGARGETWNVPGSEYYVYTIEFSPQEIEKALRDSPDTVIEDIQLSCVPGVGTASYGGYSFEEFKYLTLDELKERGKSGKVQAALPEGRKEEIDKWLVTDKKPSVKKSKKNRKTSKRK